MPTVVSERIPKRAEDKEDSEIGFILFPPWAIPQRTKTEWRWVLAQFTRLSCPSKRNKGSVGGTGSWIRMNLGGYSQAVYIHYLQCGFFLFVDEIVKYRWKHRGFCTTAPASHCTSCSSQRQAPSCPVGVSSPSLLTHLFPDYHVANPIHKLNSSVLYYLNQNDDYLIK